MLESNAPRVLIDLSLCLVRFHVRDWSPRDLFVFNNPRVLES